MGGAGGAVGGAVVVVFVEDGQQGLCVWRKEQNPRWCFSFSGGFSFSGSVVVFSLCSLCAVVFLRLVRVLLAE